MSSLRWVAIVLLIPLLSFAEEGKGVVVKLDSRSSTTPADWKVEKPSNRLRSHQFRLPGEKEGTDAELFIFPNLTGSVEDNVARYKQLIQPPEGKTADDFAKVEKFNVGKAKAVLVDASGTWLYQERPMDPRSKREARPDSRVISVILLTDDGSYLIRLAGPAATVKRHHDGFIGWVKGFKE